jgi:hypothetical protein
MQIQFDSILQKFEPWGETAVKKTLEELESGYLIYFKDGFYYPY